MSFLTLPKINLDEMSTVATMLLPILKRGDVVSLKGDLGAGKSTLARALIRQACHSDTIVPSPTFTLVQTYDNTSIGCDIWHMDWYRLDSPDQIWELGVEEAFCNCVCLIEWAENAECYLPQNTLYISFEDCGDSRTLSFDGNAKWQARLKDIFNDGIGR